MSRVDVYESEGEFRAFAGDGEPERLETEYFLPGGGWNDSDDNRPIQKRTRRWTLVEETIPLRLPGVKR